MSPKITEDFQRYYDCNSSRIRGLLKSPNDPVQVAKYTMYSHSVLLSLFQLPLLITVRADVFLQPARYVLEVLKKIRSRYESLYLFTYMLMLFCSFIF